MAGYVVRRVLWIIPVLLTVAVITFFLMYRAPGGPWSDRRRLPEATEAALNAKFGLDKPLWFNGRAASDAQARGENNLLRVGRAYLDSQFFNYLFGVARGDFGPSYQSRGTESVQSVLRREFPTSAKLGLVAITLALLIGIPLGIVGALRQGSFFDHLTLILATTGVAIPSFVVAVLAIVFFSSQLGITPIRRPEEWDGLSTAYLLPAIVLGLGPMALIARLTRSAMVDVGHQEYIRTARAKGLAEGIVARRHMLRNALLPIVTVVGPIAAELVTGSIIVESIFNVPGMGREFVTSISARDYSMIMGTTLFYAFLVVLANLLVDVSYSFLDPRIRVA